MNLYGIECHELLKWIELSQAITFFCFGLVFLGIVLVDAHLFDCSSLHFQFSMTSQKMEDRMIALGR